MFNKKILENIYIPKPTSRKGENGKLLIVGGSHLFHGAALWALTIASRIVDMVFFSSVSENNKIISLKKEFKDGIIVPRNEIDHYAKEADAILIGPGMVRTDRQRSEILNLELNLKEINALKNEGEQTFYLTKYLLENFKDKRFVIDAGALQVLNPDFLLNLSKMPILTPHREEFRRLLQKQTLKIMSSDTNEKLTQAFAKQYNCVVILKGSEDLIASPTEFVKIKGGNAGMTKGGTGDVLAGLTASLYAQNKAAFLVAQTASFLNKKAGEAIFKTMGLYFNATDLALEIPKVMKKYLLS